MLDPLNFFTEGGQDPEDGARSMARWARIKQEAAKAESVELRDAFGPGPSLPASISVTTTKSVEVPEVGGKKVDTLSTSDA